MAQGPTGNQPGAGVSHGICPSCLQQRLAALPPPAALSQPAFAAR